MTKLYEYVQEFSVRGACTCGRCIDAPENPEQQQPPDSATHTVNMTFFKVARVEGGDPERFRGLVVAEFPHWLDGKEHNYLECGADIGDQGLAIQAMGLGHVLGVWKAVTPDTLFGDLLDAATKRMMAGNGMIALQATEAS